MMRWRVHQSSLNPDIIVNGDDAGLVISGAHRLGFLDWATIERLESYRPGSVFGVLNALLPGKHLLVSEAQFYEFINASKP